MQHEPVTIRDAASGASAKISPQVGFNCYSFMAPSASGPIETLWSAADFPGGQARPSGSGIPLMFPFAGRIRGTSFEFEGRRYELTAGDGQGNAIHGFVIDRPWRVVSTAADRVVGTFQASVDEPEVLKHWPADFRITAEYRVTGNRLLSDYTIDNPDTKPLPFAFGTHPYFRVPLGGKSAAECAMTVPVARTWELVGLLPTGKTSPAPAELARGMAFAEMKFDSVFDQIRFENHRAAAKVHDPASGRTLTMTFDDQFPAAVVYNPPHREAVCIEPYTTVPDPFFLKAQGIEPHLRVLPPGESFRTRIEIRLE